MNPFDIIGKLNTSFVDEWSEIGDNQYTDFIIDRAMSYHLDTVMFANEVTLRHQMPRRWKYDFYRLAIQPKKKRFAKWSKPEENDDTQLIMDVYQVNRQRAGQILSLINKKDLEFIREKTYYGGKQ